MKTKKIFINALSAKVGGGVTYVQNLLERTPSDVQVYIVSPKGLVESTKTNVKYINTPFANKSILFRAIWEALSLPFLIKRLNIDVLFVPGGMDFTVKTFGKKKVTMFRNMLPFDQELLTQLKSSKLFIKNKLLKWLMARTMITAQHVIFISEFARRKVLSELDLKENSVIYHGISEQFTDEKKHINERCFPEDYIFYVSRLEPYKNHLNLIMAYKLLCDHSVDVPKLVLAGEFMEPTYSVCRSFIIEEGLDNKVQFIGKVNYTELPEWYRQCEFFIFPSSCENCPNILLEALGCGSAVLSSKTEPMPEFAQEAAIYFDEHDVKDIYLAMNKALEKGKIEKLKLKSKSIAARYSWESTAEKTWKLLKN